MSRLLSDVFFFFTHFFYLFVYICYDSLLAQRLGVEGLIREDQSFDDDRYPAREKPHKVSNRKIPPPQNPITRERNANNKNRPS